jgi:hypothetical protein
VATLRAAARRPGHPTIAGGTAAHRAILEAVTLISRGVADALVTAPISKENLVAAGVATSGHTELLAKLTRARSVRMMMIGERLRVVLVTTHLALSQVPKALTAERIAAHYQAALGAPVITAQPKSADVFEGANVTLTVSARGAVPLTYQWFNFGTLIPNETNPTLVFNNASIDDGGSYQLEVKNSFGTVLSDAAEVVVSPTVAPTITGQPASITRYAGAPATLTVVATGGSRLQYRWQKGAVDVPNATNASLTFSSVAAGNAGDYKVIVSNSAGSTTSDTATLTVISLPAGGYAEAIVQSGPIAYWRFNEQNGVAPTTAFRLGERTDDPLTMYLSDILTISLNLAGLPGMSVPCGFDAQGLPIGLQLIGRPFDEARLLGAAHAYEQATPWHTRRPELA